MPPTARSHRFSRPLALLLAAAALTSAGCNIVAPIFYLVHGPEKVKKVYTLDEKKTAVVFVDDRQSKIPRRALRVAIGEQAEKTLLREKVVKDMVMSQSALLAAGQDKQGKPISIAEIGQAVKADIVIYVAVDQFTLTQDGQSFDPFAQLRVKVIDVAADKRLWPEDAKGYPLPIKVDAKQGMLPTTTAARYQAEDELAKEVGLQLAGLFYSHEPTAKLRTPD